jgi:hypothetical protein
MSWNYRIAVNVDEDCYDIVECYYNKEGVLEGWVPACASGWELMEDIKGNLIRMLEACDRAPVKLEDEVVKEYE